MPWRLAALITAIHYSCLGVQLPWLLPFTTHALASSCLDYCHSLLMPWRLAALITAIHYSCLGVQLPWLLPFTTHALASSCLDYCHSLLMPWRPAALITAIHYSCLGVQLPWLLPFTTHALASSCLDYCHSLLMPWRAAALITAIHYSCLALQVPGLSPTHAFCFCSTTLWNNLPLSVTQTLYCNFPETSEKSSLFPVVTNMPDGPWPSWTVSWILLSYIDLAVVPLSLALPGILATIEIKWIAWLTDFKKGQFPDPKSAHWCPSVMSHLRILVALFSPKITPIRTSDFVSGNIFCLEVFSHNYIGT